VVFKGIKFSLEQAIRIKGLLKENDSGNSPFFFKKNPEGGGQLKTYSETVQKAEKLIFISRRGISVLFQYQNNN